MKILLMEDDPVLADIVKGALETHYDVVHAFDSDDAQECIDEQRFDLYIFDINVPGKSGIELLKQLREFSDTTPTILVTAYEDTAHLTASFDAGAHDYIRKPFAIEELIARIENSKRLFNIERSEAVKLSETLFYDPEHKTLSDGERTQTLAPKESAMLEYFLAHAKRTVSTEELLTNLWEYDSLPSDATLRSHIRRLRELVGSDRITTVRGIGYRYE